MAVDSTTAAATGSDGRWVVLTGNPNCGKTTLFNVLTGMRAKVGNYAGVTVERKEGRLRGTPPHVQVTVLDLPGSYSLSPQSPDEAVARDVLLQRIDGVPAPDVVLVIVDASNLERNLYFATQVIELGYPTVLVLNMVDVARENGLNVDAARLSAELGVPVVPTVASRGEGLEALRAEIRRLTLGERVPRPLERRCFIDLPAPVRHEWEQLSGTLERQFDGPRRQVAAAQAQMLLSEPAKGAPLVSHLTGPVVEQVGAARERIAASGVDWVSGAIEGRYARVGDIFRAATEDLGAGGETFSDRVDRVVTHRFWGPLIFVGLMFLMFQSIFTFASAPMEWIESGVAWLGDLVSRGLPEGDLRDLTQDGVIAGVGAVLVFLPQILLLFLFISLLEDTGYMSRAAFLMDRVMSRVGLHGKSFIPLLSSFACAIPGIMATRTIETPKDRLATILVAPLMSCSARLPVYTVLIAACIPDIRLLGFFKLSALTMLAMYLLGIVVALAVAWLFKRTLLKGQAPLLILELPPYKRPALRVVLRHMFDRSMLFIRRAGTVILVLNMVLWVLATYPRHAEETERFARARAEAAALTDGTARDAALAALDHEEAGERLRYSYAGTLGRAIEPFIRPLGFDWKIGIGLVASFAAREVFVSTMSTVYNVGEVDDSEEGTRGLVEVLRTQKRDDGSTVYTPLTCVTLMIFYVFALQCVSTIAVVRRETASWGWAIFQLVYMTALAWGFAFITYQGGRAMGWV